MSPGFSNSNLELESRISRPCDGIDYCERGTKAVLDRYKKQYSVLHFIGLMVCTLKLNGLYSSVHRPVLLLFCIPTLQGQYQTMDTAHIKGRRYFISDSKRQLYAIFAAKLGLTNLGSGVWVSKFRRALCPRRLSTVIQGICTEIIDDFPPEFNLGLRVTWYLGGDQLSAAPPGSPGLLVRGGFAGCASYVVRSECGKNRHPSHIPHIFDSHSIGVQHILVGT